MVTPRPAWLSEPASSMTRQRAARTLLLVLALLAGGVPAFAQRPRGGEGFLFRPPTGMFAVRAGFDLASAGSDVFTFVTDELTVDRRDFSGPSIAFDAAFSLAPRVEAVFSVGTSRSTVSSEFRDWLDNNDQPIEQVTRFQRVPITGSIKAYLGAPGRSIGRFAWVPKRYAPYIGGGGGVMWYQLRQQGDFIDMATLRVFPDDFVSDGWTPTAQGFAGTDISLTPRIALTVEGRYQWARAPLSIDYKGFDRIDLAGFAVTTGIAFRY